MKIIVKSFSVPVRPCSCRLNTELRATVVPNRDGDDPIVHSIVDLRAVVSSRGSVELYSLANLLKAGVSPDCPIRTGFVSRADGLDALDLFENIAGSLENVSVVESPKE